ncbi:MAG: hypothetical protein ACLSCQ_00710 [Evtepia gabavorous]
MKQELRQGNATGLSGLLREELEENLRRGEQSILFLNRRGNSRMVVCSQCGEVPTCPRCSVHLTYHSANGRLMCHYCGHSQPLPELCPHCYGRLQFVGMGTQKLQEALEESYPGVEIMRMDADTITATQSHEVLLDRFRWKQVPILWAPRWWPRGLDFAQCDPGGGGGRRSVPIRRQLPGCGAHLFPADPGGGPGGAGRKAGAGCDSDLDPGQRCDQPGCPPGLRYVLRGRAGDAPDAPVPPLSGPVSDYPFRSEETQVLRACAVIRRSLEPWVKPRQQGPEGPEVLGPAPAPVLKVNNRYRYRVLLKCRNGREIRAVLAQILQAAQQDRANRGLSIAMDVNPMD